MINIKSNKIRWGISFVLAFLILFGTYRSIFSLAAFLLCGLILFFCDREFILLQIFFIMPLANIFKMSPGSQSFLTILLLAYVIVHLVLPRKATLLVALLTFYILIGQLVAGDYDLFRTIKLICNLLFLSSTLNCQLSLRHREIFMSFIVGNLVSSFFGIIDFSMFKIDSYVGTKMLGESLGFGDDIIRFSGLYADPNYYSIGLIISLCLIVVLFSRKEIKSTLALLFAIPMIYFLIQTYSKSAIIMMTIPAFLLFYSFRIRKKYFYMWLWLCAIGIFVLLALSGRIPALEIVLSRMSVSDSGDIDVNKLTTGRFDLWITYAKYLVNNIYVLLFGGGVSADLLVKHASHNTYIDILYHLGVVGGVLLLTSLKLISSQNRRVPIRRNIMNYSVMICILIMYFFLGELFYFDPPFQIFIAFLVLDLPLKDNLESGKAPLEITSKVKSAHAE